MKNILLLLFTILLFGCTERKANIIETIDLRSSLNKKSTNTILPPIFDSIIKIQLETSDSVLIKTIKSIIVDNDLLYVNNNNKCHVFDKNGKYLYKIGNKGEGPNEYLDISQLIIKDKKKLIYDRIKSKIFIYDQTGRLVQIINVPFRFDKIAQLKNGNFIGYIPNTTGHEKIKFGTFNEQGILLDSIPYTIQFDCQMFFAFQDEGLFYQNNNNLYFKEYLNDTIFQIKEGKLTPHLYFELGEMRAREMVRSETVKDFSGAFFPNMIMLDIVGETKQYLFCYAKGVTYYDKKNKLVEKVDPIYEDKELYLLSVSNDNKYIITYRDRDDDENPEVILLKVKE